MYTIRADCVDKALVGGLRLIDQFGLREMTGAGEALVMPCPVMTVNERPMARVSLSPLRDANPFFHLMEALWMLAGRNDITWLDQFVGDFSKRFGDTVSIHEHPSGLLQHGAYGFRWRKHFDIEGGGGGWPPDQLEKTVEMLKANPFDRRVVLTMWDPVADLGANKKDVPCNTHIYPRVRKVIDNPLYNSTSFDPITHYELDLTVCCRSNDAIWGCHGANAVHFSILQEYIATRISVGVGKLYQLSNNYHAYTAEMAKFWPKLQGELNDDYDRLLPTKIVTEPNHFDSDLSLFLGDNWNRGETYQYFNPFFRKVAVPMREAYGYWRATRRNDARQIIHQMERCDWQIAATNWFERRAMRAAGLARE